MNPYRIVGMMLAIAVCGPLVLAQPAPQRSLPAKEFSTAGFYALPKSGREVFDFNVGWRFFKGDVAGAERTDFADSTWEVVCLPHGLELLPSEASGCVNYQGPAWYRKHFRLDAALAGKRLLLHFEAIMGKSRVFLDGRQIAGHFGGYLPIVIDLTAAGASAEKDHVIAVWADNSDDGSYPPGKPQTALDFAYFGGIYRDVWLIATSPTVYITDPHLADRVGGGGIFVHYENVRADRATVLVDMDLMNASSAPQSVRLETTLRDAAGQAVASTSAELPLAPKAMQTAKQTLHIPNPHLWHPDDPYLYRLESRVVLASGEPLDGFSQRIGVRSIEFRGAEGFFVNGKPFGDKLMGANHHQDFAYVGNAVPNSGQYRDARKLRDAGMRIIRSAHYPQDPAFMDACDELGLFVIVATPGWQFWNNAPSFADRVVSDCQQMVRRDRNHPSVIMWEPILNETGYPADFARRTYDAVHAEYPFAGCYCACDSNSSGAAFYDVLYGGLFGGVGRGPTTGRGGAAPTTAPAGGLARGGRGAVPSNKSLFTREWGDNVDDWNSHNSDSRVSRGWGEEPMLIQARHYAKPGYNATSFNSFFLTPAQHVGGALWHSFDHQRGYHPDPFWGGIMDAFRQPKYSYYMFMSQRDPVAKHPTADSGPVLFIAHELGVFSGPDITVFTNCDEVRLSISGREPLVHEVDHSQPGMPHPPIVFENVFDAQQFKSLGRGARGAQGAANQAFKVAAEGLIDGQVVIRTEKSQAKRAEKILLNLDDNGVPLAADGADFVPVIAEIADTNGNVRRLSEDEILFSVEGEGSVIGDASNGANPRRVQWGSAPALVRSTLKPGMIRVKARLTYTGANAPREGVLEFTSVSPARVLVYSEAPRPSVVRGPTTTPGSRSNLNDEEIQRQLRQVEQDQTRFAPAPPR